MEQGSSKRGAFFLQKKIRNFAKVVYFFMVWSIIEVDRGYKTSTKNLKGMINHEKQRQSSSKIA